VEVAGFCFQDSVFNAGTGISCIWTGVATFGENAHIHHCFFYSDIATGIQLEYSWNNHITDCIFQGPDYGIYCDPAQDGFAYNVIERCQFQDCSTGAITAASASTDDNLIKDCVVYNSNAQAPAAATNEGFNFTGGDRNTVADCYFSCLLPVPAAGDFDDLNTAAATDAWINCHCMDGPSVTNPT